MEIALAFNTIYNVLQESPYREHVVKALQCFHTVEGAYKEAMKAPENVYILEHRTPDMPRGEWNDGIPFISEQAVKDWFAQPLMTWYRQQGALYCRWHFVNSAKPVIYRVTRQYLIKGE